MISFLMSFKYVTKNVIYHGIGENEHGQMF